MPGRPDVLCGRHAGHETKRGDQGHRQRRAAGGARWPNGAKVADDEAELLAEKRRTTRVTVELSSEAYGRLDRLTGMMGGTSKADVIRDALTVYEYLAQVTRRGAHLLLKEPGAKPARVVLLGVPLGEETDG